jgi:hypothetical protein
MTTSFAELHLKPDALLRFGLPNIGYPIPAAMLPELLASSDDLPLAALLHWLQQRSSQAEREFRKLEPAMARLARLLAPDDDTRDTVTAMGDDWWLELGPVDLAGEIVTIQRDDELIVAIAGRDDGRLRAAAYRPLDASSANKLIILAQNPHPDGGVCMRENNWEYALDASAGMAQAYAAEEGSAYFSYWQRGIGTFNNGTESATFRARRNLAPRRPAEVAIELGLHYELSQPSDR